MLTVLVAGGGAGAGGCSCCCFCSAHLAAAAAASACVVPLRAGPRSSSDVGQALRLMDGRGAAAAAVHPSPGAAEGLGQDVAERVHYTVGCIATHEASEAGNTISRQGVQAITQCLVNWTCGVHAVDIEAFARHRGSHSVAPKDVKLALRRLDAEEHLEQHETSLTDS